MKRCGPCGATGAWGWLPLAASLCLTGCHSRAAQKPDQLAKDSNESLPCGQGYRCLTGVELYPLEYEHAMQVAH